MSEPITQTESGMYSLFIHSGSNHLLPRILNPDIPWVWVLGHTPNRYVQFWDTKLPLSQDGSVRNVRARNLTFDLVYRTSEFLESYDQFTDHGITLFQSSKSMPDTLLLEGIDDRAADQILKSNGVYLHFYLPHAYETCQVRCWDRSHLEKIAEPTASENGDKSPPLS